MTRSEMRLQLLTSVMAWRPQLDAAGVQAEADTLWTWIEKPLAPVAAVTPPAVPLATLLRVETVTGVEPAPAFAFSVDQVDLALLERRVFAQAEIVPPAIADPPPPAPQPIIPPAPAAPLTEGPIEPPPRPPKVRAPDLSAERRAAFQKRQDEHHAKILDAIDWLNARPSPWGQTDLCRIVKIGRGLLRVELKKLQHQGLVEMRGHTQQWRCATVRSGGLQTLGPSAPPPDDVFEARRQGVLGALVAAAEVGAPCPKNEALAEAHGFAGPANVASTLKTLIDRKLIAVEKHPIGNARRRITIVATGETTDWTEVQSRPPQPQSKEPAPCAAPDGPSSTDVAPIPSDPAPTTLSTGGGGTPASPDAPTDSSPASTPPAAAAPEPPVAASVTVPAVVPVTASPGSEGSPSGRPGSPGPAVATRSEPSAREVAGRAASPARRAPPPPKPTPKLRPDEQAAIAAAVDAGKVTVVPTGTSGVVATGFKGTPMQLVPPPFPDAPAWAREAAVYLQKCGVTVVTNGPGKWLLDGRWSVRDPELVERANKKRAARKLPPIVIPAGAVKAKRGAA